MTTGVIRIFIVDDHPIVRDGLAAVLAGEAGIVVAGAAESAEAMLSALAGEPADVVLMDLSLPGMSGAEAIARLTRGARRTPVVVFSAHDEDAAVLSAVRAGARGYVVKGSAGSEIARAIREVHAGGSYFPGAAGRVVAAAVREPRASDGLTPREHEVLRLVGEGLPNKQIAARLGITERTAKYHVRQIMSKLGADNRAQAVALATRRRLL